MMPQESCGVFGVYAPGEDVTQLTYLGLLALQHRGQESAGIATSDGQRIRVEKQEGRVDHFTANQIAKLSGTPNRPAIMSIGHNRYSNMGSNIEENFQPIISQSRFGQFALAHNGNLLEPEVLQKRLIGLGFAPAGTSDSELIALLIAHKSYESDNFEQAIRLALEEIKGAYSLVILTARKLFGLRDPWGIRPLSIGRLNDDNFLIASETYAFGGLKCNWMFDLEPGQIFVAEDGNYQTTTLLPQIAKKLCIFEFIYFASPGSILYDRQLQTARRHMGERLFYEYPVKIDNPHDWIVVGVPDAGTPASKGYAEAANLEVRDGFVKNRYVGRTFIQPDQRLRVLGVRAKLQVIKREVMMKKVVMVEDSIVRGTTTGQVVNLLYEAGAVEVHVRISSPPYRYRCLMGIDTQYESDLIAAQQSVEQIKCHIGADSLGYLSLEGLYAAINKEKYAEPIPPEYFCDACFSGCYPFDHIPQSQDRFALER